MIQKLSVLMILMILTSSIAIAVERCSYIGGKNQHSELQNALSTLQVKHKDAVENHTSSLHLAHSQSDKDCHSDDNCPFHSNGVYCLISSETKINTISSSSYQDVFYFSHLKDLTSTLFRPPIVPQPRG